ncbi:hypothetical protein [Croceicoccus marinus]|nr:hypothetical protein [Croceicoccus marinus]
MAEQPLRFGSVEDDLFAAVIESYNGERQSPPKRWPARGLPTDEQ